MNIDLFLCIASFWRRPGVRANDRLDYGLESAEAASAEAARLSTPSNPLLEPAA